MIVLCRQEGLCNKATSVIAAATSKEARVAAKETKDAREEEGRVAVAASAATRKGAKLARVAEARATKAVKTAKRRARITCFVWAVLHVTWHTVLILIYNCSLYTMQKGVICHSGYFVSYIYINKYI